MKKSFDATPSDTALRAEDGWVDMDVRWLLTRDTVGAEHSVFGITVFPAGSKHDIHRHPDAEEFEYLVSGHGIARVGDVALELGPGEVVFVPKNDYHGFENTGDEPVFMIWGYAGAASLEEAGYIRYVDDHPASWRGATRIFPAARRSASGRRPSSTSSSRGMRGPAVTDATELSESSAKAAGM